MHNVLKPRVDNSDPALYKLCRVPLSDLWSAVVFEQPRKTTANPVKDKKLHCLLDVMLLATGSEPSSVDVGVSEVPQDTGLLSTFFAIHGFIQFAGTYVDELLPVETQA